MMWRKRVKNLKEKDEITYKMLYENFPMPNFMYSSYMVLTLIMVIYLLVLYLVILQGRVEVFGLITSYFMIGRLIYMIVGIDVIFFMIRIIGHVWNSHKFLKNKGV